MKKVCSIKNATERSRLVLACTACIIVWASLHWQGYEMKKKLVCIGNWYREEYLGSIVFRYRYKQGKWGDWVVRWCWVNFQCQGVLLIWLMVERGPSVLAIGTGGGGLDIFSLTFSLISHFFLLLSRWETVQYRLKYCLLGPLNPKQPTK